MAGAAIPPRADESETSVAVLTADVAELVPVATVEDDAATAACVAAGASSTKTVLVDKLQIEEDACALSSMAAAFVTTGAATLVTSAAA